MSDSLLALFSMAAWMFDPSGVLQSMSRAHGFEIVLRIDKTSYLRGEPIGVDVTIANKSDQDALIGVKDLPLRHSDYLLALAFDVSKSGLVLPLRDIPSQRIGQRTALRRGATIKDVIYLQSFISGFSVGEYRIPVVFRCHGSVAGRKVCVYARTVLAFKILPEDKKKLSQIMSGYFDAYRNAKTADERDYAAEALANVESVDALPYLARMINAPVRFRSNAVYRSIKRISKDPAAIAIANESLASKEPLMTASEVLSVLSIWEYRLPDERIRELQKRQDPVLQKQLREYVEQMKRLLKDMN